MFEIKLTHSFLKKLSRFDDHLIDEISEKVELLKSVQNHLRLKVHKLNGPLDGCYSFSVNYRIRIVFEYSKDKKTIFLEDIGNHDIY
jgi:mRNA-degrading endonuclease YafQ of YafQ-DinJ toxin-antitoxin module